jgi:hypothetical protein
VVVTTPGGQVQKSSWAHGPTHRHLQISCHWTLALQVLTILSTIISPNQISFAHTPSSLSSQHCLGQSGIHGLGLEAAAELLGELSISIPNIELPPTIVEHTTGGGKRVLQKRTATEPTKTHPEDPQCSIADLGIRRIRPRHLIRIQDTYNVRLQDINDDFNALYKALSYCWGTEIPFRNTTASEAALKLKIAHDDVPTIFQEAIQFMYLLGIRYICTHALCIVQDAKDDWESESQKMFAIYRIALEIKGEKRFRSLLTP